MKPEGKDKSDGERADVGEHRNNGGVCPRKNSAMFILTACVL